MAPDDNTRTRPKTWQAKPWAVDIDAARRRAGVLLPAGIADSADWLRRMVSQWALAEVAPGRLVPWLPVAFGVGITGYFTADREPVAWAALSLAIFGIAIAVLARKRPIGFPVALGLATIAAGFATATLKTARIAHPVLPVTTSSAPPWW
jgi:competence protein ComEC